MRARFSPKPYILIFLTLLTVMSIPQSSCEKIQGVAVAVLAPTWGKLNQVKRLKNHVDDVKITQEGGNSFWAKEEIDRLRLENLLLKNEQEKLVQYLKHEKFIEQQVQKLSDEQVLPVLKRLQGLHKQDLEHLLILQLQSLQAQVIFRSPSSWSQSLWINVGFQDNEELKREVIAKNSPVVIGTAVVGVIDHVEKGQSRVRLITDSGLKPSVRVIRQTEGKTHFLAKGQIEGNVQPVFRRQSHLLKGTGFNYDFSDKEGEAIDLRSKDPMIIERGDLLITTGMDGVFPMGLDVGEVVTIDTLKEGDYFYEILVKPTCQNLDEITQVTVLPPLQNQSCN